MYSIEYRLNVFYRIQLRMDKKEVLLQLGERVKAIRIQKGLTQTELANRIGKDHPSINKLENGKVNPSYYFLYEVAIGLGINVNELV
ncbi:MAG: helix-turn-helix transcriptional regulator [Crocinitomicaceae bacterium]|nr:helix-turn-helix transcriptional regulator [Crocinitomicaceae bacterium]